MFDKVVTTRIFYRKWNMNPRLMSVRKNRTDKSATETRKNTRQIFHYLLIISSRKIGLLLLSDDFPEFGCFSNVQVSFSVRSWIIGNIYYLIFKYESFQEENRKLQNLTNFANHCKSYNIIINVYNLKIEL
jgi:hypothetical protein